MPGGDRTGPAGMGPMTGRAAGYCTGNPAPGYMYYATGLTGWQRAALGQPVFGPGMPYGVPPAGPVAPPAVSPEQEIGLLKQQAEYFASALEGIRKRIEELEAQPQKQ